MSPRSVQELDALSIVDPEIQAIIESGKIPKPNLDFSDPYKALLQIRAAEAAWGGLVDRDAVSSTSSSYQTRDKLGNRLLIFRPTSVDRNSKLKAYVHLHGGGGCMGSPESTAPFCQEIALSQHCIVFSVQYRLGPEHKFPAAVEDSSDAILYILGHAADFGIDPALGFVIGGHSMGASMSAVISLHAEQLGIAGKITGLYLGAGAFVGRTPPDGYDGQLRSREDPNCLNTLIYDQSMMILFKDMSGNDIDSPWCRACNNTSMNAHRSQPRSYFQVCGMDYLRDDGLIYEDILRSHGIETKIDIYPGADHIFWNLYKIRQTTKWEQDTQSGLRWLFGAV